MKIKFINKPFNYFVIDDFYNDVELASVMEEVVALKPYALDQGFTNSANENGTPLKNGKGIFLDTMFGLNRSVSKILTANRKIFDVEFCETLIKHDASFGHILNSNSDSTLLNYYSSNEYYLAHKDTSPISLVTFLEVGKFKGGGFSFTDYKVNIPFKHNRVVIFPGCVKHQAQEIKASEDSYRVSIAQFIGYEKTVNPHF